MNALFLAGTATIAFVFGYRFFAKLLALGIFRLGANYSTEAAPSNGANRHLLLIHHAIILSSGATVVGSVIALTWGWIPAFLWIVVGATVGGGMLNMGTLWLATRHRRASLHDFAAALGGRLLGAATVGIAMLMLVLLAALCTVIAGKLLAMQPMAVPPAIVVLTVAWLLGRVLRHRSGLDVLPIAVIALIAALVLMWFAAAFPVSLSGALNLDVSGTSRFSVTALIAWVLALSVFGFVASHANPFRFAQPYALLNMLLLAVTMIVMLTGLFIERPAMVVPEFHAPNDAPGLFPWLFILLCSGAVSGLAFVAAVTTTAPRLPQPADARYVGYGGAMIEAVVALSAVLLGSVAFHDAEPFKQNLGQWPALLDVGNAAGLYLDGFVRLAAALDIEAGFARTLAATVVTGLCLTTLEAALRMLTALAAEATAPLALPPPRDLALRRVAGGVIVAGLALATVGGGGAALLIAYGAVSLALAAIGFALLVVGLRASGGPVLVAAVPAVFLALVVLWFVIAHMAAWWQADRWGLFLAGILLLAAMGAVALALARAFRTPPGAPT